MKQNFTAHSPEGYAYDMRCSFTHIRTVHSHIRDLTHSFDKLLLQAIHLLTFSAEITVDLLGSLCQPRDAGHILRTGTHSCLLPAAVNDRIDFRPLILI